MIRFPIAPRLIPMQKVARRLGVTAAVFREKLPALYSEGFPRPDPVLENWSLEAVDAWIDRRFGSIDELDREGAQAEMMKAIRNRAWEPKSQ